MNLYKNKKKFTSINDLFHHFFDEDNYKSNDKLLFLVVLVDFFRPKNPKNKTKWHKTHEKNPKKKRNRYKIHKHRYKKGIQKIYG